ncbi:thiol:disulfide interchange protein DsbA/DsbL [Ramlibacter albus]|uniref:Thiol:disulfide interchange protein n=1 Tax=Ramlibacter albus TaxID=2079448 RepID=A0A923M529_9BURK|nr:thiol:disulfide interchange protein DsbA/DsbL [Ramlibacter albus]MBC5764100.1 thiol:disulfide interchange protein DsbA/DsbL [Ramlibacter albus]
MDRRQFSAALGTAAALGFTGLPAHAQRAFADGKDFRTLDKRAPVETPPGKVEVVEFFWYACPHCNAFEPQLVAWAKKLPQDVVLKRVPVQFNESFEPQQRLFYTLEAMGKLEDVHNKVFQAIHGEKIKLERFEQIAPWVEKQGVDKAKFTEMFNSFSIATKARKAAQLANDYRIEGVPTLGVAGRWWTDGSAAGSMQRALQVTDFLIAEARRSK